MLDNVPTNFYEYSDKGNEIRTVPYVDADRGEDSGHNSK